MAHAFKIVLPVWVPETDLEAITKQMEKHNISFSEKGSRRAQTIKPGKFKEVIEVEKRVVQKEIEKILKRGGDVTELEKQLIEMDAWDLSRFEESKAMRMATSKTGSELN